MPRLKQHVPTQLSIAQMTTFKTQHEVQNRDENILDTPNSDILSHKQ